MFWVFVFLIDFFFNTNERLIFVKSFFGPIENMIYNFYCTDRCFGDGISSIPGINVSCHYIFSLHSTKFEQLVSYLGYLYLCL